MSSNAGGTWSAQQDTASQARMNQKTNTTDTGTNLAAINPTFPGMEIFSLDTSGGFNANTKYVRDSTNSTWLQMLPTGIHDHSSTSTGGLFSNIIVDNIGGFLFYNYPSPVKAQFLQTVTGGTISDVQGSGSWNVQLSTGTVANNLAQADIGGIALDFGNPIKFSSKLTVSGASTSLQGRIGQNIEAVGAAVSLSTKCLGFEFCDSTGANYQLVSCDGGGIAGSRSVVTTNQPFLTTTGVRYIYTPSVSVVGTIGLTTATTKTSNLPNSGATTNDRIARFGIQTTNTVAKSINIHGFQLSGTDNDTFYT